MSEANTKRRLRLYLIRHGEVEGAADGKLIGRTDAPLSERGLAQSRRLAEQLSAAHLSAIYSSDLKRAQSTAEVIAARSRLRVQPRSDWREIDMGDWEGRTIAALHAEVPERVAQLFIALYVIQGLRPVPKLLNVLTRIKNPKQDEILNALG